ncbi:hypothetical protein UFOVP225_51 [uncultured Caudovirales phage]|uniref:Uncharacterized protein n=1 Tax=uncultured Caudovirales phage TaxID=2100421 RepID=A0A6J5L5W4_9CAUD|nr:hypothetical protein UFOVP113_64 [uncultured Caudovirales phage]CAB5219291.1 hypothetical protein UFOVP225_51 [uncultured Caudovirales phage]
MAENIEGGAHRVVSGSIHPDNAGTNALIKGATSGWFVNNRNGSRGGRGGGRTAAGGAYEPSAEHWQNMETYANGEHQRRIDFLREAQYGPQGAPAEGEAAAKGGAPDGTFAHNIEYGDRGIKVGYTERRPVPAATPAKGGAKAGTGTGRSRQTAGTTVKPSTGSKSRGAEVGAAIGGPIGTALGALVPVAGETGASEAVGGILGAKAGEAIGGAVSNAVAKSKAKKAAGTASPAVTAASSTGSAISTSRTTRAPKSPGSQSVTRQKDGTWK